jgi:predicted dehydrogenase
MGKELTRRSVIKSAASAAIGVGMAARTARAAADKPNEKVGIGFIGTGGRGTQLMRSFNKVPNARIVAVCDVHKDRLANGVKAAGTNPATYGDFRNLLEDPGVDAVVVATPGHWHVLPAIDACAAGKDVYIEKPIGTSIGEGRALIRATKHYKRLVQPGTQQRSWPHYQEAVEVVRSGLLGEILNVHVWDLDNYYPGFGSPPDQDPPPELDWDFWLGPAPKKAYNPNYFAHHYWFYDYGNAWQVEWAVHHYDIVNWAMGVTEPISAVGLGAKVAYFDDNREWPDTFTGACVYAPGPVAKKGFVLSYTFRDGNTLFYHGCTHGKAFHGTDGSLVLHRGGYTIHPMEHDGKKCFEQKTVIGGHEFEATVQHAANFVNAIRNGTPLPATIEDGHHASNPGHLMNIAFRTGRKVRWDAENERVIDDAEANKYLTKPYRAPWKLPFA